MRIAPFTGRVVKNIEIVFWFYIDKILVDSVELGKDPGICLR